MKKLSAIFAALVLSIGMLAQPPQKLSYQAVVRNAAGKLVQNSNVGIRISILQSSVSGTVVYSETHGAVTNVNGLVALEIGNGTPTGVFSDINWANGPYFLKSETDPAGGTNYSVTGVSQLLSVPYALHAQTVGPNDFGGDYNDLVNKPVIDGSETSIQPGTKISVTGTGTIATPYVINSTVNEFSGDYNDLINKPVTDGSETNVQAGTKILVSGTGTIAAPYVINSTVTEFSGDYNDLINKPVTDGSETKIQAGTNISITGTGTTATPYVVKSNKNGYPVFQKTTITSSQVWSVPAAVSKIKVELWGASGGGGGAGAYSYSYNLTDGGDGGSGGYAQQEIYVVENQQFNVLIGNGGYDGINAYYIYPWYYGDTDGGNGGDTWFGPYKAAGGTGGKRGSYSTTTVHGNAGIANFGTITGYADPPQSSILNVFMGLQRSYLNERILTSKSGKGGSLSGYSEKYPTQGEGGAAVITLFE